MHSEYPTTMSQCERPARILTASSQLQGSGKRDKKRIEEPRTGRLGFSLTSCWRNLVCIKARAAMLILAVNVVISDTYSTSLLGAVALPVSAQTTVPEFSKLVMLLLVIHCILAVVLLLYPLGGFLADVHFGRYRVISISLFIFLCGTALECIVIKIVASHFPVLKVHLSSMAPLGTVAFVLFVIGFSGYQANIVQFGLDQLQEAPSETLSVFLHWFVWTETIGQAIMRSIFAVTSCYHDTQQVAKLAAFQPEVTLVILTCLMCLCYNKKDWFYMEPEVLNPYRMVLHVLKFAKKHKYPIQRSAFAYNEDEKPSRIDFAKEKYGGPFTTEEVEDVKTFFRILVLLFCIGVIFTAEATIRMFPLFGIHISGVLNAGCQARWMLMQSGTLSPLLTAIVIPLYVVVAHSVFRKKIPTILTRLNVGIILTVLSILSILLIDAIGHKTSSSGVQSCVWTADIRSLHYKPNSTLNLSPSLLVIPTILIGLGPPLVYITVLEFISAQSPHTMKGLLFGVFYAVKGLFELLGTALLYPFILGYRSNQESDMKVFPISCGTGYYLVITAAVGAGLVMYWVAVRRYRYRQREEQPYNRMYVERYFEQSGVDGDPEENEELLQTRNEVVMRNYLDDDV